MQYACQHTVIQELSCDVRGSLGVAVVNKMSCKQKIVVSRLLCTNTVLPSNV